MNKRLLFLFFGVFLIHISWKQTAIANFNQQETEVFSQQKNTVDLNFVNWPVLNIIESSQPLTLKSINMKYPNTFFMSGANTKSKIALTFDDAPDATFTPLVLDILKKKGVKATFFVVGNRIEKYPEIAKRIVKEGHTIGNHSYNHANFTKLNDEEFREQINKTDTLIKNTIGFSSNIMRPPYGNVTEKQIHWLAGQHKKIVYWNVDSLDWKGLKAKQVINNVLPYVRPGSIILQHSGTGNGGDLSGTVNALPIIIDELKKKGFNLVTVPELLNIPVNN